MPTDKDNLFYQAGKNAFREGQSMADKPRQYLTAEWDHGFIDALAEAVRELKKGQQS